MLTKIDNAADHFATLQAVDLFTASFPTLLAKLAALAPDDEPFEVIIRRDLLPDSYRYNPSMLAKAAWRKVEGFQAYTASSLSPTHISLSLLRTERPVRRYLRKGQQSVNSQVLLWLESEDLSPTSSLDIPIEDVPYSLLARPEQFVYNIKRQTGHRIKITRFKKRIKITLK